MEKVLHPTLWQTQLMRQPQLMRPAPLKERLAVALLARLQTPQADMTRPVRRRKPQAETQPPARQRKPQAGMRSLTLPRKLHCLP